MAKQPRALEVLNKSTVKETLSISLITPLQGELKDLSPESANKLRKAILKLGFIFPLFIWENPEEAIVYCLDGHSRLKVLNQLADEGYKIPQIPVVYIEADNLNDAKEKLIAAASQYGKFNEAGALDFFSELEFPELDFADIPVLDFNFSPKLEPDDSGKIVEVESHTREIKDKKKEKSGPMHECPKCGFEWEK